MHHPISPIDGRYADRLQVLSEFFSEKALMRERCRVELLYVLALTESGSPFPKLSTEEYNRVQEALNRFTEADYRRIKAIEQTTRHDVKACEMFLRERVPLRDENLWHFALTSEDVNNLAYSFLLRDYVRRVQLPQLQRLIEKLADLCRQWRAVPFPCRTHGQKASPSTAGKELAVFVHRLLRRYEQLANFRFAGKLNGAIGNYSAMLAAFPDFDWQDFSRRFVEDQGLQHNALTTQIEDHDAWADYFNIVRQTNNIVLDLDTDCWLYISYDLFYEKSFAGEVGSSTMPHKVNPINFENSEGNLLIANSLLAMMSDKLCRSRMQRDLSDSTVSRNIGAALAHGHLAWMETGRGLDKLQINQARCLDELQNSPELLAEPIQTLLKTVGVKDPYNLLKQATRGQRPTRQMLLDLVEGLDIPPAIKERVRSWSPENYIGHAVRLCDQTLERLPQALKPRRAAVIGSGGREHALAWKLSQSLGADNVHILPGNSALPGSQTRIKADDFAAIEAHCYQNDIDMIVVGPEQPLAQGIVDYFRQTPIRIVGPTQAAARLEGSKIYAKQFMRQYGVATADFEVFQNLSQALPYLEQKGGKAVIKYDGLAAGKGVFVCNDMLQARQALDELHSQYGETVDFLVEDRLIGDEISIIGLTDGKHIRLFQPSQDHKQLLDGDQGPNTGGMGAFCPVPFYTPELAQAIDRQIVQPTLRGIRQEGLDYKGFLYFGIMLTAQGPLLLEYNARLGDPETEVLLPALKSDLYAALTAVLEGNLEDCSWEYQPGFFVDVVLAAEGYPKQPQKGKIIRLNALDDKSQGLLFYAGVRCDEQGQLLSDGGRVLNAVAWGDTLEQAIEQAYRNVGGIEFEGMHYRRDIGKRNSNL